MPLLATLALDERVLNENAFLPLGFVDALVSQIGACRGIDGVYIVIAQAGEPGHPYKTSGLVMRGYASLCRRLRQTGRFKFVLPNFCDIAGFACLAHGASGFATGNFQSTRRLMLSGSADGRPFPYYYAHAAAAEFRPEDDLNSIAEADLFEPIADPTPFAASLVGVLRETRDASGLQPWLMTINNVGTAQRHQVYRTCVSAHDVLALPDARRYPTIETWVREAASLQAKLLGLVDEQKTRYVAPVEQLLAALRDG